MKPNVAQAIAEYEELVKLKRTLGTVDEIASRHGLTRQMLLYHAGMKRKRASALNQHDARKKTASENIRSLQQGECTREPDLSTPNTHDERT